MSIKPSLILGITFGLAAVSLSTPQVDMQRLFLSDLQKKLIIRDKRYAKF